MQKSIQSFLIFLILLLPMESLAAYVIQLKNGSTLVTSRYWEEGNQIFFQYYGGVAGVQKDLVQEIRDKEPDFEEGRGNQAPVATKMDKEAVGVDTTTGKVPDRKSEEAEEGGAKTPDDQFRKEFNLVRQRFLRVREMSVQELYQYSKELDDLKKRITKSGMAQNYNKELLELYSIGDELEEIIKARGQ